MLLYKYVQVKSPVFVLYKMTIKHDYLVRFLNSTLQNNNCSLGEQAAVSVGLLVCGEYKKSTCLADKQFRPPSNCRGENGISISKMALSLQIHQYLSF